MHPQSRLWAPALQRTARALRCVRDTRSALRVEPEMHHVAVGDDVFLAFEAELAGIAGTGFAVQRNIVLVGDGLGADKALLEVGVDHTSRARRLGAAMDGPGARFLRAHREIG